MILAPCFTMNAWALATNEELKIGITQEFENLNPAIKSMMATTYISGLVIREMVVLSPDGKWVAQLAKKIPSIENGLAKFTNTKGQKGLVSTWELQDQAKWGDGTPVTCKDLQFAWSVGKNPNVSIPEREAYENITKIEYAEKNPKKCTIHFAKAKWDFYKNIPAPLPAHIEEAVLTNHGSQKEGYDKNTTYVKNPLNPGLYNGPYRISEIQLGSHVSLVPNPQYYGKAPAIKKIVFKLIPNTGTLEANLRSGTIDMVSTLGFSFDQALAFEKKVKNDGLPFKVLFKPSVTYEHIDLNLSNPILADKSVRQALVYAIDREQLVQALFESKQPVAKHLVAPMDANFTMDPKKITVYKQNRVKAAKLLDEAGWKLGSDGYRQKNGQRLSLQFQTTAGNKTRETVQTMLQSQWKSVGAEITIKNDPARVFFSETMSKRKFGALGMFAWISSPESSARSTIHSGSVPTEANSWSGQNYTGYANKMVDELINKIDTEFSAQKRKAMTHEILKHYTEDVPAIPLYYRSDIAVIPANMTGYRVSGSQYPETFEVENWTLQTAIK